MGKDGGDESHANLQLEGEEGSVLSSNLFLDHVGEVILTLNSDGLSWKLVGSPDNDGSICLGIRVVSKIETEIKFSDAYAVEFTNQGIVHEPVFPNNDSEVFRFTVHGFRRSKAHPSLWGMAVYTFGHKNLQTCQMWVNQIYASLNMEIGRPKNLLVFVHPLSGKGHGCKTWETVAPIFSRAKVRTKVIVTERAGHAFDVMASITNMELNTYDGVVAVGGDGLFNEILNGLLSSRHKASYPPAPTDLVHSVGNDHSFLPQDQNEAVAGTSYGNEDESPLLPSARHDVSGISNLSSENASSDSADQDLDFPFPNAWFRFGIIPSGSTDAIAMCTTGSRDPITSALHIVLGKRVCLDIAQVVRWKKTSTSSVEPCVRYAASFAGYGFYGDVITESEKYRWMGPKRYDYAGTKVFMKHRSYEAEISFLEVKSEESTVTPERGGSMRSRIQALQTPPKSERVICRVNCNVCQRKPYHVSTRGHPSRPEESRWLTSKGRFLSVGAAIISCRNERAPDGLVADAHLSDGFLHLILIKDCPRAFYLWHLTQLARKGGKPLNLEFVEHHKTPAFTFTASGKESVWNLDGEAFPAHQLSAQVLRGLVTLFASGPEV